MVGFEKFLKIFKSAGLSEKELTRLYWFAIESSVLYYSGRGALSYFIKLESEIWPFLDKIDGNFLKETDEITKVLAKSINKERNAKLTKWQKTKKPWLYLRKLISERTITLQEVCKFTNKDIEKCREAGERLCEGIKEARRNNFPEPPAINISDAIAELLYENGFNGFLEGGDEEKSRVSLLKNAGLLISERML